jgi:hypothetical protein
MNLNDEYLPYKHTIGQVILDVGVFLLKYVLLQGTHTLELLLSTVNPSRWQAG